MCPKMKGTVCNLVDLSPISVECVNVSDCLGSDWRSCGVYISQFFFDKDDELID
jgi:hypothetical protein